MENDFYYPTTRSEPQKNDVRHSHQCLKESMSSNFEFSISFSIDAISVYEDQLHVSVHLIWRVYVAIRYLSLPYSVTTMVTSVSMSNSSYVDFPIVPLLYL